jgi:hypothetical protein
LRRQHVAAKEPSFFKLADPAKAGFQGRGRLVDFMPIKAHCRFQAQRIARAKAAGNHAQGFSRVHEVAP